MLANDNAGRARAFFKVSSRLDLLALVLRVSGCWLVERNLFVTGPASSADERGLETVWVGIGFVGCERLVRCI